MCYNMSILLFAGCFLYSLLNKEYHDITSDPFFWISSACIGYHSLHFPKFYYFKITRCLLNSAAMLGILWTYQPIFFTIFALNSIYYMHELQIPAIFISIIVLVAAFMIMVLAIFLIIFFVLSRNKQNNLFKKSCPQAHFKQELLQSQLETQEYSFNQISQELHDNIGQLLSSTKMLLSIGIIELQTVPDAIKTAEQTVAKAIQDLRSLSKSLNREWLDQFNLIENLETEKERINVARNIEVTINSDHQKYFGT